MMILRNVSSYALLPLLLAMAPTATRAQLFGFPPFNNNGGGNLIPEWLPQCFTGVDGGGFNPSEVVNCVRDNAVPSCLQSAASIQETFGGIGECISNSVSDEVNQFFGGGENANNQQEELEQALATSRQAGGGGDEGEEDTNNLQDLVEGFLSDIGEQVDGLLNIGNLFVNATRTCLDPLADCVQESIEIAIETLHPCLNDTLTELVVCGQQHGEVCLESCNASQVQNQFQNNTFELSFEELSTCSLLQSNLMDPFCNLVGCCEPCVPQVEALTSCIVNQQLDQVPLVGAGDDCQFVCPPEPERRQRRHLGATIVQKKTSGKQQQATPQEGERVLQTVPSPTMVPNECLQFAPGLTGDDTEELSVRSSIFLPCVYNSFVLSMQDEQKTQVQAPQVAQAPQAAGVPSTSSTPMMMGEGGKGESGTGVQRMPTAAESQQTTTNDRRDDESNEVDETTTSGTNNQEEIMETTGTSAGSCTTFQLVAAASVAASLLVYNY